MGLRFYLLPFAGSLGGFQRFDISNWLHMLEDLIRTVIMVALLASGQGLVTLALAILGVSVLKQAAAIVWLRRLHPQVRFSPGTADRSTARELLDYSGITFGITICWMVIYNTDSILLGLLVSTSAAGIYAAGAQVVFYMRNVVNVIASPLTAEFSAREAAGDMAGVGRLYLKTLKYTSFLSFFMSSAVIIYARPFVALWLSPEFADASEVMRILAVGSAFLVPQIVGEAVLFAVDRHRLLLRALLIECCLRIGLSLWLIPKYGLLGMAYAAIIPQVALYVSLYPAMLCRVLKLPLPAVLMSFVQASFPAMFACVPVAILMRVALPPLGWVAFAANVTVVSLATLAAGWLILAAEDRAAVLSKILRRPTTIR